MNNNLPWNDNELELIQAALSRKSWVDPEHSLAEYRIEALDSAQSRYDNVKFSSHYPHEMAYDLFVARHIRYRHSNQSHYTRGTAAGTALNDFLRLIAYLKVTIKIQSVFPELSDAISFETIKRVRAKDRVLLLTTILGLADRTALTVPASDSYEALRAAVVRRYNEKPLPGQGDLPPMDADSKDPLMLERVNDEMVRWFIAERCSRPLGTVGMGVLEARQSTIVRNRFFFRGLKELVLHMPQLTAACERRVEQYREKADMSNVRITCVELRVLDLPFKKVCRDVIFALSHKERIALLDGKTPSQYLEQGPDSLPDSFHALVLSNTLSESTRYEEFIHIAESMNEPMAKIQKERIRRLFLGGVQDKYPELTEAVQAELRLLPPEPDATIAS